MNKEEPLRIVPTRKCGHQKEPTIGIGSPDGKTMTCYCLFCIVDRINECVEKLELGENKKIKPVAKLAVEHPKDWNDINKIKILFDE